MEHLPLNEVSSAIFLLAMGAARYYYFIFAGAQPADQSSPAVNWARHVPAYFTSAVWIAYVAWLIVAPAKAVLWDRWPVGHPASDVLGWGAIPLLAAAFWLFWYSHSTIGHYWSIQVRLKAEHQLVTRGPYRYIRHPLYTALFLGYLGTLLAQQSWMLLAWFPVFVASYLLFATEEENVMEDAFGETYRAYRRRTGMFLPKWAALRADVSRVMARRRARG